MSKHVAEKGRGGVGEGRSGGGAAAARDKVFDQKEAILWQFLAKVAGREGRRELLAEGSEQDVRAVIAGEIDGSRLPAIRLAGRLAVGRDRVEVASMAAPVEVLVGYLLGLFTRPKRAEVLRLEKLPEVDAERIDEAKGLLARLRGRVEKTVRGNVSATAISKEVG